MKLSDEQKGLGSWSRWVQHGGPVRLGVSSCLLGNEVRHDGGHRRDRFVTDRLAPHVELLAVCPEMEVGLGAPRPTMRLVASDRGDRLVVPSTGEDLTERMTEWSDGRAGELAGLDLSASLDGFILKRASPSCALERLRVYSEKGVARRDASGLFTQALRKHLPQLPLEEEGRLCDPRLRANFLERVYCHHRWRAFLDDPSPARLVEFHTVHKLLLRTHGEKPYSGLGRLVARQSELGFERTLEEYGAAFHRALENKPTVGAHVNVLQHILGYLKDELDSYEKEEVLAGIEDYREGLIPRVVPVRLLRMQIEKHGISYLQAQLYLDPLPKELDVIL